MKITKSQLKQIIKEELDQVQEIAESEQKWWVKEMKRVLTDLKDLHDATRKDSPQDLELFKELLSTNIGNNFPWISVKEVEPEEETIGDDGGSVYAPGEL